MKERFAKLLLGEDMSGVEKESALQFLVCESRAKIWVSVAQDQGQSLSLLDLIGTRNCTTIFLFVLSLKISVLYVHMEVVRSTCSLYIIESSALVYFIN